VTVQVPANPFRPKDTWETRLSRIARRFRAPQRALRNQLQSQRDGYTIPFYERFMDLCSHVSPKKPTVKSDDHQRKQQNGNDIHSKGL
jgi:hypothetical protein